MRVARPWGRSGVRRWLARERGQAVVEFALVLPLILIFVLGMMQIGLLLNTRQQLADVARAGVRTYALTGDAKATYTAVGLALRQLPAAASVTYEVTALFANGSGTGYNYFTGNTQLVTPRAPVAHRGDWVTVSVTYRYANPIQASVGGFRLPPTFTLVESATARSEYDPSLAAAP